MRRRGPRSAKGRLLAAAALLIATGSLLARRAEVGPADGSTLDFVAARDVWISAVAGEQDDSHGATRRLKLKVWQEMALVDFDVAALAGRRIESARLYLRPTGRPRLGLNGGSDLRWLTLSTVGHAWEEGASGGFLQRRESPGATFRESSRGRDDWGGRGSRVWHVSLGNGNTLRFDGPLAPAADAPGWLAVDIDPDLVAALVAGASHGLLLMDGSTDVGTNSFVSSRESGEGPLLRVAPGAIDRDPPAAPTLDIEPAPRAATAERGALAVGLEVPAGAFAWEVRVDGRQIERWRLPFAAAPGVSQTLVLTDLPPGREVRLEVAAVDRAGNRSPFRTSTARVSPAFEVPELDPLPEVVEGEPPALAGGRLWAFPEVTQVDPRSGALLGEAAAGEPRRGNTVWDAGARKVRLTAARGEIVGFQLALEEVGGRCSVEPGDLEGDAGVLAGRGFRMWRNWYLGRHSEYALPLEGELELPSSDDPLEGRRLQALSVDLHVPVATAPGEYAGTLAVVCGGDRVDLIVAVTVHDVVLPEEPFFQLELNAYQGPGRAGSRRFVESFRLAHYHRATINRVPYSHRGAVHDDWAPRVDDEGRITDWSEFDRNLGGALDGSWFAGNPRSGVPVPVLYLPLFEGWPLDFREHYRPGSGVPVDAVDRLAKLRHDILAPPLGEALDRRFKKAFVEAVVAFREHLAERGWTRTRFQIYLNNKPEYGYTMWTLDEPFEYLDWAAINTFADLAKEALEDDETYSRAWQERVYREGLSGLERRQPVILFRADVSRPMWQGSVSDGRVNSLYVSSDTLRHPRLLAELERRMPAFISAYGSPPKVGESHWRSVLWCLRAFVGHADGVLPWQSLGGPEALVRADPTALLIDAGPHGAAVASLRLHALRRGAQDAELLRLLELSTGWSREQIGMMLRSVLGDAEPFGAREHERLKRGVLRLLAGGDASGVTSARADPSVDLRPDRGR